MTETNTWNPGATVPRNYTDEDLRQFTMRPFSIAIHRIRQAVREHPDLSRHPVLVQWAVTHSKAIAKWSKDQILEAEKKALNADLQAKAKAAPITPPAPKPAKPKAEAKPRPPKAPNKTKAARQAKLKASTPPAAE